MQQCSKLIPVLNLHSTMPKKQKVSVSGAIDIAVYNDLRFPKSVAGADYNSCWGPTMTSSKLYKIIASWESAVLFAAREGWVHSTAPHCSRDKCQNKMAQATFIKEHQQLRSGDFVVVLQCTLYLRTVCFITRTTGPRRFLN